MDCLDLETNIQSSIIWIPRDLDKNVNMYVRKSLYKKSYQPITNVSRMRPTSSLCPYFMCFFGTHHG